MAPEGAAPALAPATALGLPAALAPEAALADGFAAAPAALLEPTAALAAELGLPVALAGAWADEPEGVAAGVALPPQAARRRAKARTSGRLGIQAV